MRKESVDKAKVVKEKELSEIRKAEDEMLKLVKDSREKQSIEIERQFSRQIEDLRVRLIEEQDLTTKARGAINNQIIALEQQKNDALQQLSEEQLMKEVENRQKLISLQLESVKAGSEQEYQLKMQQLVAQRDAELANKELTEQMKIAITEKYNKLIDKLTDERLKKEANAIKEAISLDMENALLQMQVDGASTLDILNEKVRISSIFMLAAKYIQMEKYKEANIFLDKIPDTVIDGTIMKTNVLAHQEGTDIAAFFLEGKLMQTVTNIQNYLYKLIEMEEETGNHCKAEEIAEITEHMVLLFDLWDYGKVVPYLLIAVYRKDVEKCIQLIKEVLMESQKPWKMVESPLYYRYADTVQGKSFSGVGNNFVRALATEIENKEEYEFLKGNKELEAIFSQYLK